MAEEKGKKTKRPTAQKRDIRNAKRREINKAFKSKVRTAIRGLEGSLKSGGKESVSEELNAVYSLMDQGVKRGVYKLNKANRTKASFAAKTQKVLAG